jgi:hypothetical protein
MKRLLFAALLTIVVSCSAYSRDFVASGQSHSALGDYKIETSDDPVVIDGAQLKTYIISYQNSPLEVKVVIKKGKNCKNYIVLSDKLSVQYVCNENYFGVEKLDKSLASEGYVTSDEAMNRIEYFHQKVISSGMREEVENAHLIASYFPMLIKGTSEISGGAM